MVEIRKGKSTGAKAILLKVCLISLLLFGVNPCFGLTDEEIQKYQTELKNKKAGERIAFFAEKFLGTPYDQDPLGAYVTRSVIVADDRVDCMYLTFRAVELALGQTPEGAIQIALEKRFHSKGILKDGKVINYEGRFEYGEDMIFSGKWGRDITRTLGRTKQIEGSRGRTSVEILPTEELLRRVGKLKSGDLLFLIKDPKKRIREEIVGHIGVIKRDQDIFLIHAAGNKERGGEVKKVRFIEYLEAMPFIGAMITRFD